MTAAGEGSFHAVGNHSLLQAGDKPAVYGMDVPNVNGVRCVRIGSDEHKQLFCQTFIATHEAYEPRDFLWPSLDEASVARLRSIPIWSTALQTELNAGAMVSGFAATLDDSLIRDAVRLQGYEEARHARMIGAMVERYGLDAATTSPSLKPSKPAFVHFGYSECVDSFFGFGAFRLARELRFVPDALISLFTRVLAEEARHIVFFVNWIAYERSRRLGGSFLQTYGAAIGYLRTLLDLVRKARQAKNGSVSVAGDGSLANVTIEYFLAACVAENEQQMSAFDPRLLRPRVIPGLAKYALAAVGAANVFRAPGRRPPKNDDASRG